MKTRDRRQNSIGRFKSRLNKFDLPLLAFLIGGWLLIFAAATLGLQRDKDRWLPVRLGAQFSADYSARSAEGLQLARVDPKIIEAVKQDIELRKRVPPTPAVVLPATTPTPTPTATVPSNRFSITAGGPYSGPEGSPISLKAGRANALIRLVPGSITYRWDLDGDEIFDDAEGQKASVTFFDEGTYPIGLHVTDFLGRTAVDRTTIQVRNVPPIVQIGADQVVEEATEIRFSATARDPGHDLLLYEWDFGDRDIRTNGTLRPIHVYPDDGAYVVRLRVTDNDGGVTEEFLTVYVENVSPEVDAGPDQVTDEGQTITLEGTATDPSQFDTLTYAWDLDFDGLSFDAEHLGPTASVTYPDGPANIVAALLVQDEDGGETLDLVNITVNNLPPTILSVSNNGPTGEGSPLTLAVEALDPGNDTLTYTFDWTAIGSFGLTGSEATVTNVWTNQGDYTVRIGVDDGDGGQVFTTTTVSIVNRPPIAVASANIVPFRFEGEAITFDGSQSNDPGSDDLLVYTWNFGDGTSANGPNATHVYADNNTYQASLTVTDDSQATATVPLTVTILNANPVVKAGSDKVIDEGVNVVIPFDATATTDPGQQDSLAYAWDFSYDGDNFNEEGAGALTDHLYPGFDGPQEFEVALRVRDDDYPAPTGEGGQIGEALDTLKVTVRNLPPKNVNAGGPYMGTVGVPVTLTGSATDVPGDLPLSFRWDLDYNGTLFSEDAVGPVITHTWTVGGQRQIALRVMDNDGGLSEAVTTVNIGGWPTAVAVISPTVTLEGNILSFNGSGSSDPDGDPLRYTWNFGDGTPAVTGITTTHAYLDNGVYTTTLQVNDGRGGTDSTQTGVTINNVAPTAVVSASSNSVEEGQSITFDGSSSTDPGLNDTLAYEWDLDYDGANFSPDETDQTITVTYPDGPFTPTIALRVTDDDGAGSPLATVQITVNNAPPIAVPGTYPPVSEGSDFTLDGGNSSDPGGDDLIRFEWDLDYDGSTFNVDKTGQTVTASYPDGPAAYTVALRVTDEDGGVSVNTTQITVNNVAPTAEAGSAQEINLADPAQFDGGGSSDPGADSLSFRWDFADGDTAIGQIVTHTWAATGTYTVTLQVTDDDNAVATDTVPVQVNSLMPVAYLGLFYILIKHVSWRHSRKSGQNNGRSSGETNAQI